MEKEEQGQRPGRRGRRPTRPDPGSGPVGAFADRLWRLKQEAGDPSYEEMSARLGAAASKSSLAAAAQGRSLPSWETTWEFVRVLAVDRLHRDPRATEQEWRDLWTRARAEESAEPPAEGTDPVTPLAQAPAPLAAPERPRRRRRLFAVAGLAVASAVLAGAGAAIVLRDRDAGGTPPAVAATGDRDDSQFEGDVTHPDGSLVAPNSSFTKIWRIRNTGTVIWANRFLARMNDQPCEAPKAVAIPETKPGETVDIAVPVKTPGTPGRCKIYWKMADEQGRMLFPLKRPIFLDVRVGTS